MANENEETSNFHSESFLIAVESANANEGTSLESTSAESESASFATQIEVISSPDSKLPEATPNTSTGPTPIKVNFQDAKEAKNDEGAEDQLSSSRILDPANYSTTDESTKQPETNIDQIQTHHNFEGEDDEDEEKDVEEPSFEDDTISSEAVVDDIELILMPETVQDFTATDLSPQLVRVTELKRSADYDADVFRDDDEETDQESDFKKMCSDDEFEEVQSERSRLRQRRVVLSSGGDDNEVFGRDFRDRERKSSGKVNSGVQTDITALENTATIPHEFRRKSSGKSRLLGVPGKRLNWKSELTLLPSKTKIRTTGFSGYESMNYQDQYSPRVAKFTSQDTLSSSSQFLKPSTLYRTRNLSRNLNQCTESESTLVLPGAGMSGGSGRYRDRLSSSTSGNFKGSSTRRQPLMAAHGKSFRSSLPDLSSSSKGSCDNKEHRQSFKSMRSEKSSSGNRLQKKSSSDDETSSLIDESERCLRSSIDLLLTDDLPSPGADLSCRSTGFGPSASHGYYSSRRSHSQPVLTDDGDYGDMCDVTMGSPFLPRKISEMRCSRWAKVILPNGQVAVVAVKETDELRDTLTIHTDTGCILSLPFRKVVFAWRIKR